MTDAPVLPLDEPPPAPGHNSGDPFAALYDDIDNRVAAFLKGVDIWAKRETFDKPTAERAADFMTGARRLIAEAEKARVKEKAPVLERGAAIDAKWSAVKDKLAAIIATVKPKAEAFAIAEKARLDAERKKREEDAARERAAAEAAAAAAAMASTASEKIEAEAQAKQAAKSVVQAERAVRKVGTAAIKSATGLGRTTALRRERVYELVSATQAFVHFKDAPELHETLRMLAAREGRAAGIDADIRIPGFNIIVKDVL